MGELVGAWSGLSCGARAETRGTFPTTATTLKETDCPLISISGDTHHFSCFEAGPYVSGRDVSLRPSGRPVLYSTKPPLPLQLLAVFSDLRGLDAETPDTADADARISDMARGPLKEALVQGELAQAQTT
jgi:hypothetical protein